MAFVVNFNGSEEVNNLTRACASIHNEIYQNWEQLYRH